MSVQTEQTITSLEVAELTGKRHDSVIRDIRNLLNKGVNAHNFVEVKYKDEIGRLNFQETSWTKG